MLAIGNRGNRKQATGRLFAKAARLDFGNVQMYQAETPVERVKYTNSRKGINTVVDERVSQQEFRYKFTLTEELEAVIERAFHTKAATQANQAAGTDDTESFTLVQQGQTIVLAKRNLSALSVEVSAAAKTLNTDYTVDLGAGTIYIIPGGGISNDDTIDLEYDAAAVSQRQFTSGKLPQLRDTFVLHEEDDDANGVPRAIHEFTGVLTCTERGDQDGKKEATWGFELLATADITVTRREDS